MSYHALVVDDTPDVLEDVRDRLEALGHTCDCAGSLNEAREYLLEASYSYILLDLEIPVRYGRPSRIANGQNLLIEIRKTKGYESIPIIVMTSHGHDSPDLAIEVLRGNKAIDYVKKPFADQGHTLEKAIRESLVVSKRSLPGAKRYSRFENDQPPQRFEEGQMVFFPTHVELCGVRICGDADSGIIRQILDELRHTRADGTFVKYSGAELAKRIDCERGQHGISEAVRDFRNLVYDSLLQQANIRINRMQDIIINDRRYGYRLSPKITIIDATETNNDSLNGVYAPVKSQNDYPNDPVNYPNDPLNNSRQRWIIEQLNSGIELRKADIIDHFDCSASTAQRDLRDLRKRGMIQFVGPAKTGYWKKVDMCLA